MKRKYIIQENIDRDRLLRQAHARRSALRAHGCTTYAIGLRAGRKAIICLCCGLGSHSARDVDELYCGFCGVFHEAAFPNVPWTG